MLKLIKLEWKKNNIGKYIRNAVILAIILCTFLFALAYLGIANDPDTGVPDAAPGNEMISSSIELFTGMSFLVFTGVMLASFIVTAYKNKTMNLMFSYPIRRQKILVSQMLAVWIFNLIALILTKLLVYGCVLVGSLFMKSAFLHGKCVILCAAYSEIDCDGKYEFYCAVYRSGNEIIQSNDHFVIPSDFFDTGEYR